MVFICVVVLFTTMNCVIIRKGSVKRRAAPYLIKKGVNESKIIINIFWNFELK